MKKQGHSGWAGKLLRVDLSARACRAEAIDPYIPFLGGRGMSDWIVFQENKPSVRATDPGSVIALGTGPLAGTLAPGACRSNLSFKSVATGGISTANVGGHFGAELKYAGFDQIVIEGRAESPVYLWVRNGVGGGSGRGGIVGEDHLGNGRQHPP